MRDGPVAERDGTDRVHLRVDRLAQAMQAARDRARPGCAPRAVRDTAKPALPGDPLADSADDAGTGAREGDRAAGPAPVAAMTTTGAPADAAGHAGGSVTPDRAGQVAPAGRASASAGAKAAARVAALPARGSAADSVAGAPLGPLVLSPAERVDRAPGEVQGASTARLSVRGLRVIRDGQPVLDGCDLDLAGGRVTALVGASRAGSAVLLRAIMGLERARAGSIRFDDIELRGRSTPRIARAGLGYLPGEGGVFLRLSVAENLALAMPGGAAGRARRDWVCGLFPALGGMLDRPAADLLAPQRRLLGLARLLVTAKRVYLLDQPAVGLPPGSLAALRIALSELRRSGAAILLAEETMAAGAGLADDVLAIEAGRVIGGAGRSDPKAPRSAPPISSARAALAQGSA